MRIFGLWLSALDIFLLIIIFILIACLAMVFITVFEGDPQKVKTFIQQQTGGSNAPAANTDAPQIQSVSNVQSAQPQPSATTVPQQPAPSAPSSSRSAAVPAKFCAYCGSPLNEGNNFCTSCGQPIKRAQ